ncbi:MAG: leucine-rich repeat domain-containing protein [Caldilineaceae bacterium]|nr:leucine-rich repeat domain-containing protein [Caldilineaceae bacterium]
MKFSARMPATTRRAVLLWAAILAVFFAPFFLTNGKTYAQSETGATQTPAATSLSAPKLTATAAGDAIELTWTAVPGAARYVLFTQLVDNPGWQQLDEGNLTATSHRHRGLVPGTTYQYAVRAIDAHGQPLGPWSNFPTATALAATGAATSTPTANPTAAAATLTPTATASALSVPSTPALTAQATEQGVELRWQAVQHAVRYELFTWWDGAPDWKRIGGGELTGASYTHSDVTAGTRYFYTIRAVNAAGETSGWLQDYPTATALATTGAATSTPTANPTAAAATLTPTATASALSVPSTPALTAQATEQGVELRWQAVQHAVRYELFTWWDGAPDWKRIGGGELTGASYTHSDVTAGTRYFYTIRAVNAAGETSGWLQDYPTATALATTGAATSTPAANPTASTPSAPDPAEERAALAALYRATDGTNWKHNDNWLTGAPLGTWHGVFTDESGNVTELRLEQNRLRGSLSALNALTHLTTLYLYENELTGPIPDLNALTNLKYVWLSDNRFSGPIPALNSLTNLSYLNLLDNRLTGPIPDLSALTNLRQLILGYNQLTGSLPDLSAHTYLWNLNLSDNQLTGPIPARRLPPDLWNLVLDSNQLTGPIPDLSTHTNLNYLRLNDNQLTGPIPDLRALTNLTGLYLGGNQLTGSIPDLSALTKLRNLSLYSNQLTGSIPNLSTLTELDYLRLNDNQLTGSIPDLSALTKLTYLDLEFNRLTGPILNLSDLTRLTSLSLRYNQFTGPVPDLSALTNLTWLSLRGNQLCLPQGSGLSGANQVVTEHLNSLNLPACTAAELALMPGAPQNLTATVGDGRVTLTWSAVANAAGYELRVWDSINRDWGGIGGDLRVTSHTHTVLKDGRNYYYQVRARDVNGVRGPWSEQVYAAVVTPRYPPPPSSLGVDMLYQKYLETNGVAVVAPSEVSDAKMARARETITGMLSRRADLLRTMAANNLILFMEIDDIRGIAFKVPGEWEAYVRANDPNCGNFIHEFAHVIHYAIEEQAGGPAFNTRLLSLYQSALNAGRWAGRYASTNAVEYWAETVKYWLWGYSPYTGYATLADYDPEIARLIEEELGGATVPAACKP